MRTAPLGKACCGSVPWGAGGGFAVIVSFDVFLVIMLPLIVDPPSLSDGTVECLVLSKGETTAFSLPFSADDVGGKYLESFVGTGGGGSLDGMPFAVLTDVVERIERTEAVDLGLGGTIVGVAGAFGDALCSLLGETEEVVDFIDVSDPLRLRMTLLGEADAEDFTLAFDAPELFRTRGTVRVLDTSDFAVLKAVLASLLAEADVPDRDNVVCACGDNFGDSFVCLVSACLVDVCRVRVRVLTEEALLDLTEGVRGLVCLVFGDGVALARLVVAVVETAPEV